MGIARDRTNFLASGYRLFLPINSGTGKASKLRTSNVACRYIHMDASELKPIKILEKRERGHIQGIQDCPDFLGTPYYLRNG